jgi:prepilin-type N-terminal cleavage/methylation domain-containing protein
MRLQYNKKGFTLIELLVVITIIGILATGAVTVYTSQIQKARDTTRITSMNALKGGLEQAFQDMSMYPGKAITQAATTSCDASATQSNSSVYCVVQLGFLNALPRDPKDGKSGNNSSLVYTYSTADLQ